MENDSWWKANSLFLLNIFHHNLPLISFPVMCEHAPWSPLKLYLEGFRRIRVKFHTRKKGRACMWYCFCWPRTSRPNMRWPCRRIKIHPTGIHNVLTGFTKSTLFEIPIRTIFHIIIPVWVIFRIFLNLMLIT